MKNSTSEAILVVDDEKFIRDELEELLKENGYQVTVAENGFQAIEKVKVQDFQLVILDFMMPELNGFETLEGIRKIVPHIPAIMLTGYSTVNRVAYSDKLKIGEYIPKSSIDQLLDAVARVIKGEHIKSPAKTSQAGVVLYGQTQDDIAAVYWERSAEAWENMRRWELAAIHYERAGEVLESDGYLDTAVADYERAAKMYEKIADHEKVKRLLGHVSILLNES